MCFEVYLPSIDRSFDIDVEGNLNTVEAVRYIVKILEERESIAINGSVDELMLGNMDTNTLLNPHFTLLENGVKRGMKILMV